MEYQTITISNGSSLPVDVYIDGGSCGNGSYSGNTIQIDPLWIAQQSYTSDSLYYDERGQYSQEQVDEVMKSLEWLEGYSKWSEHARALGLKLDIHIEPEPQKGDQLEFDFVRQMRI